MSSPEKVFEALSSTTRRKILAYLRERPLHAGAIADRFDMSKPAVSKHLSVLESAGLIWKKREGQFILYGMEQENLAGHLWTFMQEVCPPSRALRREVRDEMEHDDRAEGSDRSVT
ncbi:metalloregulator ArsR/SmtB family transcription factor [Gymnodinialimonas ulvae]|uniref:metalloregulator ArsR/SmtB family transcription factor n=1 Tax=Gymnodinialimonas ulvae TaxID=3126504 RepID=UPI0030ADAC21